MFDTEPQTKTEDQPPTLAEIVREETDNGREIIRFLLDVMRNRFEDVKMCHRVQAAVQLAKLGSKEAEAFLKAASCSKNGRAPSRAPAQSRQNDELADIVKQETSDGRDVVRFLVDVMHGNLDGFKPCHRLASAKELLRRGFDSTPVDTDDDDQDRDDDPISQERIENRTRHNAKQYNDDGDPFDFDHYNHEDYIRDGMGHRAELHIFGGEEAREVALNTARELARESRAAGHIGDYDYSPIENPEDDPYGKGCYGYKVLRIGFQNNNAIRAINKAVAEYHRRKFKHFINEDGTLAALADTASLDPGALQYLERSRHLLTEENGKPPKDPDPPSAVTPERSEEPPAPTTSSRQKPPKIHLGPADEDPPDDTPRQRRDPGEIRIPLCNLLSMTAGPL